MNPVAPTTEPLTIRQTHLRAVFDHCPAMAWALAVEKRPGPTTPGADRGTAVHQVFGRYVHHLWGANRATDWEAAAAIARDVVQGFSLNYDQRKDVLQQAARIAEGFVLEREHFYGIEEALDTTITLHDGREVTITGTLDLLMLDSDAGVALILDAKSNHSVPPASAVATDFQLMLYALLVIDNLPAVDAVEGSLYLTRYGITVGGAAWTRDELEEFRGHLRDRLTLFYAGKLRTEYVPGSNCQYCPRRRPNDCSLWRRYDNTTPAPIRTFYQARKAAGRVIALEQERETLLAGLKGYGQENGPVTVGDTAKAEVWAFHASPSEEFSAAAVRDVLQLPEVLSVVGPQDFDKLFKVDRAGATFKRLRKAKELHTYFDDIASEKVRTTFGHKAVSDE